MEVWCGLVIWFVLNLFYNSDYWGICSDVVSRNVGYVGVVEFVGY